MLSSVIISLVTSVHIVLCLHFTAMEEFQGILVKCQAQSLMILLDG